MKQFKDIIRTYRKAKGLTQKELADDLNVNQTTVSEWEQGRNATNTKMLEKIAMYFNIDINELMGYPSDKELAFRQGLQSLNLDKFKALNDEDKEFLAAQFNALIDRLEKK